MLESVVADCGPDTVVYDVGANVGMYAITIGTVEPQSRILAFEPAPTTVEHLRANIGCNELNSSVEVHHCGLGASTERQQFHFSTYPELSGFDRASATRWGGTIGETVSVSVRRMDDVVKSAPSPDVVKIDVEGVDLLSSKEHSGFFNRTDRSYSSNRTRKGFVMIRQHGCERVWRHWTTESTIEVDTGAVLRHDRPTSRYMII